MTLKTTTLQTGTNMDNLTQPEITRYTHGFYKFGTMERHPEGDWVKHEDLRALLNTIQSDVLTELVNASRDTLNEHRRYCAANDKATQLKKYVYGLGFMALVNATALVISVWGGL